MMTHRLIWTPVVRVDKLSVVATVMEKCNASAFGVTLIFYMARFLFILYLLTLEAYISEMILGSYGATRFLDSWIKASFCYKIIFSKMFFCLKLEASFFLTTKSPSQNFEKRTSMLLFNLVWNKIEKTSVFGEEKKMLLVFSLLQFYVLLYFLPILTIRWWKFKEKKTFVFFAIFYFFLKNTLKFCTPISLDVLQSKFKGQIRIKFVTIFVFFYLILKTIQICFWYWRLLLYWL